MRVSVRLRTPIYSTVMQVIPYENGYKRLKNQPKLTLLQRIDEVSGLTAEEQIIGFCEIPRSKKEVTLMLGMSVNCCTWIWQKYLQSLIEGGKLKMTIPNHRASKNQRFVSGEIVVPTEVAILEFCAEPKSRAEINGYFGLTSWTSWTHISPLVESGRLNRTIPSVGMTSPRQKFTTQEVDAPVLTDVTLKEFCVTPRSRAEIATYFNLEIQSARRFIVAKAKEGVLIMTKPDTPDVPSQRYIGAEQE